MHDRCFRLPGHSDSQQRQKSELERSGARKQNKKAMPKCKKCDTAHVPGDPCRFLLRGQEPPAADSEWGGGSARREPPAATAFRREETAAAAARRRKKRGDVGLQSRSGAAAVLSRKIRTLPPEVYNDPWKMSKGKREGSEGTSARHKIREE